LLGVVTAVVLTASVARAEPSNAVAAESLFNDAQKLFGQGKTAEACELFAKSQKLDPGVGTLMNLGRCYKELGRTASAWLAYREAEQLAHKKQDARRAEVAHSEAEKLEGSLAKLQIDVEAPAPGIVVSWNGVAVDPASFGAPIPVDPGNETLTAQAPKYKPWTATIDVAAGTTKTIRVPALEPEPTEKSSRGTWATGLEIGGGVALAGSLALGTIALIKWNDVGDVCPDKHCPNQAALDAQNGEMETSRTFAHASTIAGAVGIVALAAGIYLHLTDSKRVEVAFGGTSVGLRLRTP
jgi:hypothetical protein